MIRGFFTLLVGLALSVGTVKRTNAEEVRLFCEWQNGTIEEYFDNLNDSYPGETKSRKGTGLYDFVFTIRGETCFFDYISAGEASIPKVQVSDASIKCQAIRETKNQTKSNGYHVIDEYSEWTREISRYSGKLVWTYINNRKGRSSDQKRTTVRRYKAVDYFSCSRPKKLF